MVTTRPPKTIVKPTALGPVANTDTKLLIYGLFQKGRVLAQDGTLQQFREAIPCEHYYRFVIFDRDTKFSEDLRKSVRAMGVRVLRTTPLAPQANCYCERWIGTSRRECLDFLIPLSEKHLRRLLCEWRDYYNRARPHSSLGANVPEPASALHVEPAPHRHQIPSGKRIVSRPVLGGLHHDYRLARAA